MGRAAGSRPALGVIEGGIMKAMPVKTG